MQINEQESLCLNITLAIATIIVLLLTFFELIMPIVTFTMGLVDVIFTTSTGFISTKNIFLFASIIATTAFSILLFMVYLLQLNFTFKKKIMILRHVANILFTVSAICLLVASKKTSEEKFLKDLAYNWGKDEVTRKYESKHSCNGYEYNSNATSNCFSFVSNDVNKVFNFGRKFSIPCALWWTPIIFYSLISIVLLIIDRFAKF